MFIVFVQICFTLVREKVIADFMVQQGDIFRLQYISFAMDKEVLTLTQLDRNKKIESGEEKY